MINQNDANELSRQAMALYNSRHLQEAKKLFWSICNADMQNVQSWMMTGIICGELGEYDEAVSCMRHVIKLQPNNAQAHYALGNVLHMQGKQKKAVPALERAVRLSPNYAAAWGLLGAINTSLGNMSKAVLQYKRAVELRPDLADLYMRLADVLSKSGKYKDAVSIYLELGKKSYDQGRPKDAIMIYTKAIEIDPDNDVLYSNMGHMYQSIGDLDKAEASLSKASNLNPHSSGMLNNMGNVAKAQGRIAEAEDYFRRAIEIDPSDHKTHSNLLLCLQSKPDYDRVEIFHEHIRWAKLHTSSIKACSSYRNQPDPDRKLRIGYVSPDLRTHAVGYLVEPILANHDPGQYEIFCYAEVSAPDNFTKRLRSMTHAWRSTCNMSDSQLVAKIRSDEIDILVDLAGHTNNNRLKVFAYKPAPVQVSYLGYSDTTGMSSIDYRLTDEVTDPAGDEIYYSENVYYLRNGFSCYAPPAGTPEISRLPAGVAKAVTFACLNNLYKINPSVLDLWSRILHNVPASRMIIFRHVLKGKARDNLYREFEKRGIDGKRVDLQSELPAEYYQKYPHGIWHMGLFDKIDIMLDTFPRDSHVIACEALWMGVPIVTLYGGRHSGRICASVLTAVGLPELIASTPDEYLNIAAHLANNLDELELIRKELRDRMKNSSLCDAGSFTKILEEAYRDMWARWCSDHSRIA